MDRLLNFWRQASHRANLYLSGRIYQSAGFVEMVNGRSIDWSWVESRNNAVNFVQQKEASFASCGGGYVKIGKVSEIRAHCSRHCHHYGRRR